MVGDTRGLVLSWAVIILVSTALFAAWAYVIG
jgi:hypothetical protein